MKRLVVLFMALIMVFTFVSCEDKTPVEYTVSYEGIERVDEKVLEGSKYAVPGDIPAKPGFITVIKSGDKTLNPGDIIEVTGDIKLVVSYVPGDYKVTFEGVVKDDAPVKGGEGYTVPSDIPVRPGYVTVIKSGDKTVDPGDVIEVTGDIKLVISYVPGDYKVTFKGVAKEAVDVKGGTDYTIPKDLVKKGHKLTSIMYGTEDVFSKDTITVVGNIELEYVFTEVYTVTFSENTGLEARTLLAGDELALPYVEGHNIRSIKCGTESFKPGSTITVNGDMTLAYEMLPGTADLDIQDGRVKEYQQTKEKQIVVPDVSNKKIVYKLDSRSFKDLDISSIVLPNTLSSIDIGAFANCKNLKSVYIPAKVDYIQNGVFQGCSGLEEFKVDPDNKRFCVKGNCLVDKQWDKIIASCKNSKIEEGVRILGQMAFYGVSLTNVVLPASIEEIHDNAFGRSGITEIRLNEGLVTIRSEAFTNNNIETIRIPSTVKNMELNVFSGCKNLKTVYVAKGADKSGWLDNWLGGTPSDVQVIEYEVGK